VGRTALWLAYPLLLWVTGFLNEEERHAAARLLSPATIGAALRSLRETPPPEPPEEEPEEEEERRRRVRLDRETLEAEQRDEDAIR
jgi:hypothetical protein